MNISDAEKTVINGLTQKDESTIASTDLVQLYAQDGTPNGKISKADLMDAVKASLPALLSDQSTNGTDFLSLASGVLGKMTAANLASVLGAYCGEINSSQQDSNLPNGFYRVTGTSSSSPDTDDGILIVAGGYQIKIGVNYARFAVRSTYATNWKIS